MMDDDMLLNRHLNNVGLYQHSPGRIRLSYQNGRTCAVESSQCGNGAARNAENNLTSEPKSTNMSYSCAHSYACWLEYTLHRRNFPLTTRPH
jgi:hypothetical protein